MRHRTLTQRHTLRHLWARLLWGAFVAYFAAVMLSCTADDAPDCINYRGGDGMISLRLDTFAICNPYNVYQYCLYAGRLGEWSLAKNITLSRLADEATYELLTAEGFEFEPGALPDSIVGRDFTVYVTDFDDPDFPLTVDIFGNEDAGRDSLTHLLFER
jgi:hypothetical protein